MQTSRETRRASYQLCLQPWDRSRAAQIGMASARLNPKPIAGGRQGGTRRACLSGSPRERDPNQAAHGKKHHGGAQCVDRVGRRRRLPCFTTVLHGHFTRTTGPRGLGFKVRRGRAPRTLGGGGGGTKVGTLWAWLAQVTAGQGR